MIPDKNADPELIKRAARYFANGEYVLDLVAKVNEDERNGVYADIFKSDMSLREKVVAVSKRAQERQLKELARVKKQVEEEINSEKQKRNDK
jgi:hypothetical protein